LELAQHAAQSDATVILPVLSDVIHQYVYSCISHAKNVTYYIMNVATVPVLI
jgi:hypothetical protein